MPEESRIDTDTPRIWACLAVAGEFNPAELTNLLGVDARTRRKGEVNRGRRSDFDSWHYSTEAAQSVDWPSHLEQVLALAAKIQAEDKAILSVIQAEDPREVLSGRSSEN